MFDLFLQFLNRKEYERIMVFINARQQQDGSGRYDELRRQRYKINVGLVLYFLSFSISSYVVFYTFPWIEYASKGTYRFAQRFYFPFDFASHSLIYFVLAFIFMGFCMYNAGTLGPSTWLFNLAIIEHLNTELDILGLSFENVIKTDDTQGTIEDYKELVKHHRKILGFVI